MSKTEKIYKSEGSITLHVKESQEFT